jgi:hypothetical protein
LEVHLFPLLVVFYTSNQHLFFVRVRKCPP